MRGGEATEIRIYYIQHRNTVVVEGTKSRTPRGEEGGAYDFVIKSSTSNCLYSLSILCMRKCTYV